MSVEEKNGVTALRPGRIVKGSSFQSIASLQDRLETELAALESERAELAATRSRVEDEAYQTGLRRGLADGREEALRGAVAYASKVDGVIEALATDLAPIVVRAIADIVGAAPAQNVAVDALRRLCAELSYEAGGEIYASPDEITSIEQAVREAAPDLAGTLAFFSDDDLAPGQVEFESDEIRFDITPTTAIARALEDLSLTLGDEA